MNPAERLASALDAAEDFAIEVGAIKGRDPREPGLERKTKGERRMQSLAMRMFKSQQLRIERWAGMMFQPVRLIEPYKADTAPNADEQIDATEDEWRAEWYRQYLDNILEGIRLWAKMAAFDLDYSKINIEASRAAQKMSLHLIRDVNATTKQTIREAIREFVETPGMTLGDVMKLLPFDADRAERIAITEITRAYAQANVVTGMELQRMYPGVKVVKYWFTNQDDLVCDVCGPLDTGKPVKFTDPFNEGLGIYDPPAHPNCRCWTQVTTDL